MNGQKSYIPKIDRSGIDFVVRVRPFSKVNNKKA